MPSWFCCRFLSLFFCDVHAGLRPTKRKDPQLKNLSKRYLLIPMESKLLSEVSLFAPSQSTVHFLLTAIRGFVFFSIYVFGTPPAIQVPRFRCYEHSFQKVPGVLFGNESSTISKVCEGSDSKTHDANYSQLSCYALHRESRNKGYCFFRLHRRASPKMLPTQHQRKSLRPYGGTAERQCLVSVSMWNMTKYVTFWGRAARCWRLSRTPRGWCSGRKWIAAM